MDAQSSGVPGKGAKTPVLHSRVPSSGPSQRATFTTSLSIPVIGTRAVTSSSGSNNSSNDTSTSAHSGNHASTGVVPSGPAPARMASSRMATNGHIQPHTSISIDDGFREGGKHPDLGLEPIKVASVLDLNSVRTQSPRPPASVQGSSRNGPTPALGEHREERPFGLEDCPAFYPTEEEWHDPMAYIRKIAPTAEQSGICKIVPPEGWNMPFVTNTETFRFKTRLQTLNQVEASSRAKIQLLEQIYRFHKQHLHTSVVIPIINHHTLDIWLLRKEVHKLGGYATVTDDNKWADIGRTMGYSAVPNIGAQLKQAYHQIIQPYEEFIVHVKNSPALTPGVNGRPTTIDSPSARVTSIGSRGAPMTVIDHVLDRQNKMGNGVVGDENRMARTKGDQNGDSQMADSFKAPAPEKPRSRMSNAAPPPVDEHGDYCEICKKKERPSEMLLCDGCDGGYHTYCLDPPLPGVPKGQWFCHSCLDGSNNDFGFEDGADHSLMTFQARDLAFRKLWFESHPPPGQDDMATDQEEDETITQTGNVKVSEYDVEREYWRLVRSAEEAVEVEYGADIHSTSHGSGMPTSETHPLDAYSRDPWNLNNLPIISDSLLRFIKSDISGMTVPWTYVGMIFSTFCWHNEDHYTFSVNYMHWGATKTWYGVPGGDAEKFEAAIRSEAPELFEAHPDLLYQLVTLMSPDRLKQSGVRVVACNQRPGEFVVTFPKAYHAGFNQGFNFNEAVNFALPEWLPLDLESVLKYKEHQKAPVFSHDELLCTIMEHSLSIKTAIWLKEHLIEMRQREMAARERVRAEFPSITETVEQTEGAEEDQLQCLVCKSFCYLSRVGCDCTSSVVCQHHAHLLCDCDPAKRVMQMRYNDGDLEELVNGVVERANQPSSWRMKLAQALAETARPSFRTLKNIAAEGDKINYPLPELANLKRCIERGELWMSQAAMMLKQKKESRRKKRAKKDVSTPIPEDLESRERTMAEAEALMKEASILGFDAPEIGVLNSVIEQAKDFKSRASALLEKVQNEPCWSNPELRTELYGECQELLKVGWSVNLTLDETDELNLLVKKFELLSQLDSVQEDLLTLSEVRLHLEHAKACGLTNEHPLLEILRGKLVVGEEWEKKANDIFESKIKSLKDMEEFAELPHGHPIDASVLAKINTIRGRAKEMEKQAKALMFPEGAKRTKVTDAQRLIGRAAKDFNVPSVQELSRVLDFAIDLESRCEAVLNKRHPQSESESVFDAVRKWRAYADEHLVSKFHLPQYEMLKSQLDQHDKWYNRLPFPKPRRDHVELLYKDVAECTKSEDDAAPTEEFCTCICTLPVRPPPPGTVSDAVQCDHCHARFHPQCAGGSCPFCDHHHWNGSLHRTRYYHSFDVLACVRPVPDLTRNYSRLWKQIEFIATRIARLQNVITHFLAFAAQTANQRPEIIPQVRHYMRKLFKIQLAISPKPNVSYGLDLAGLHRILAGQKKNAKRRKRPKVIIKQEGERSAPDGTQCFCHGQPVGDATTIKCHNCSKLFHAGCLHYTTLPAPEDYQCPICATKRGKIYRGIEVRVHSFEDPDSVFVDIKKTVEGNRDVVKVGMGEPNGPCIVLDMLAFYPAEEVAAGLSNATSLPSMPSMSIPSNASGFGGPAFFPSGHLTPHLMVPLSRQPSSISTQVNPAQLQGQSVPALPAPPATSSFSSSFQGEMPPLVGKKRKPSLELRPTEQKRQKGENGLPTPPAAGMSTVDPRDVIDLTFDDSVPMPPSPTAASQAYPSTIDPALMQPDRGSAQLNGSSV